jgi:hypothetical protein
MKVVATKSRAYFAGIWGAAGLSLVETFGRSHPTSPVVCEFFLNRLTNFVAIVVFFFAPVGTFVVGWDWIRRWWRWPTREYFREMPPVWLRGLCWFLGTASFVLVDRLLGLWP